MSTIPLTVRGSPYLMKDGLLLSCASRNLNDVSEIIVGENDLLEVEPGVRLSIVTDTQLVSDFDLFALLDRCEATRRRDQSEYTISIPLNTLRVIALYYSNIGYAGMNIGEFMRRTLTNGEDDKKKTDS